MNIAQSGYTFKFKPTQDFTHPFIRRPDSRPLHASNPAIARPFQIIDMGKKAKHSKARSKGREESSSISHITDHKTVRLTVSMISFLKR
jgi:hypothetical protein